jgi:DNA-binding beta-propeller fold protein YncE
LYDGSRVGFTDPAFDTKEFVDVADGNPLNGATVPDGFWFTCQHGDTGFLSHVSNRKEVGRIQVNFHPDSILVQGNNLYVSSASQGFVAKVDSTTGEEVLTVPLNFPVGMASINGAIWVTLANTDEVVVLDPDNLAVKARHAVGDRPWKLATGLGSVWVTNSPDEQQNTRGTVSRLDPDTGQRIQPDIPVGLVPDELAIGDGLVYVGNRASNSISVIGMD